MAGTRAGLTACPDMSGPGHGGQAGYLQQPFLGGLEAGLPFLGIGLVGMVVTSFRGGVGLNVDQFLQQ